MEKQHATKSLVKSERGFTIIELAVVAAIVGILAIMGTTAYGKFSARTKQREGKLYLSNAFLAERTFFAEHLSYTQCLRPIRGLPGNPTNAGGAGENVRPYYIGFANGNGAANCGPNENQSCYATAFSPTPVLCNCAAFGAGGANDCAADSTVRSAVAAAGAYNWAGNRTTFTIGIAGFVGDSANPDVWTINQDKVMTMINNGL